MKTFRHWVRLFRPSACAWIDSQVEQTYDADFQIVPRSAQQRLFFGTWRFFWWHRSTTLGTENARCRKRCKSLATAEATDHFQKKKKMNFIFFPPHDLVRATFLGHLDNFASTSIRFISGQVRPYRGRSRGGISSPLDILRGLGPSKVHLLSIRHQDFDVL